MQIVKDKMSAEVQLVLDYVQIQKCKQRSKMKKLVHDLRVFGLAFLEAHLTNQGGRLVAKTLRETWSQLEDHDQCLTLTNQQYRAWPILTDIDI